MFNDKVSKKLYDRAGEHLATGVSTVFRRTVTPTPLYMTHGDGPYLFDVDGHKLLDYGLAWGPLILGNNHPKLNEAITAQLGRGYTFGYQHEGEILLAELMCKVVPGVEQVLFSNTGSEAVQAALRIARAYTGREKIVRFEGHYHGWMNNVLVKADDDAPTCGGSAPTVGGQPADELANTLSLTWNDIEAVRKAFDAHPDQIACVITEPLNINNGSCMPDDGYLQGLVDLCHEHGALCIFDEVVTGFRIALGGAREYCGVQPDMSTYAKAMAGGFSMAGIGGRRDIFDTLSDGRTTHAGTYNGNPICLTAAFMTISTLSEPGTYDRMNRHGHAIREALERAATDNGHQLITCGAGTAFSAHFDLDAPPRNHLDVAQANVAKNDAFRALMLEQGVACLPAGRWYIGAAHTDDELDITLPAIEQAMKSI